MADENIVNPDDERLLQNQALRHDIITHLISDKDGKRHIPDDLDALTLVKSLLKDSDASVFTKKRLTVDEAGVENDRRAAELLEQVMSRAPRIDRNAERSRRGPDISRGELPNFSLTNGETSQVGDVVDLDRIVADGRATLKGVEED